MQIDSYEDKYFSAEEVLSLVNSLNSATLTKLYKIASNLEMIYRYDAESLVHDAIVKLLEPEGRRWRRDFSIFTVFKIICWSILDHYTSHFESEESLNEPDQDGKEPIEDLQGKYSSPEQQLIVMEIQNDIHSLFRDDPIAKDLIDGQMEGYQKGELLEILAISDKEYETTWKRIRRRMKKDYQGSMK